VNLNALGFVLIGCWNDLVLSAYDMNHCDKTRNTCLDNLVSGELQSGNTHRITSHKIAVKDTKYRLMSNDEKIILLAFEL